nr:hypothetical protein [Tanacetum cinerariifolium]
TIPQNSAFQTKDLDAYDSDYDDISSAKAKIPQNSAFQTEYLDAYDPDCDDISLAKAVLMANLLTCDSDVLFEVPYSDTYPNDMINQDVLEMSYFEQTHIVDFPDNEITSDSNIVPYSQYLQESQDAGIQVTNSSATNDLLVLSLVEQMTDHVANLDKENQTNKMVNESLTVELERYKERVTSFKQRNAKFEAFQQEIDTLKQTLSNHCSVDKNALEIHIKQLRIDNDQLLNQIISQEIMHIVVNSVDILDVSQSYVNECNKRLELETELLKKKDDNSGENQNASTFNQLFKNELKAQSQEKDTVIRKLKDMIKSLTINDRVENVKKDIDEIERINIELEQSVTHVRSKEHSDSLIAQINAKSVENSYLNAQLQEKVFAIASLKTELRKLKGKNVVDIAISASIAPGMFKLDI